MSCPAARNRRLSVFPFGDQPYCPPVPPGSAAGWEGWYFRRDDRLGFRKGNEVADYCRVMFRRDEPEKGRSEEVFRRQGEKGAEFAVDEGKNAPVVEGADHGGDVVHQRTVPLLALTEADLCVLYGRLVGVDAVGPDLNPFQDDGEGRSLDVDGLAVLPPPPAPRRRRSFPPGRPGCFSPPHRRYPAQRRGHPRNGHAFPRRCSRTPLPMPGLPWRICPSMLQRCIGRGALLKSCSSSADCSSRLFPALSPG